MTGLISMTETVLQLIQIFLTLVGGGYALFLYNESIRDKKTALILSIFNRLYDDPEIRSVLYALDKNHGLEELNRKLDTTDIITASLEKELDKTLRFLDYLGWLIDNDHLRKADIKSFSYEINTILNHKLVGNYLAHLQKFDVRLDNLKHLF